MTDTTYEPRSTSEADAPTPETDPMEAAEAAEAAEAFEGSTPSDTGDTPVTSPREDDTQDIPAVLDGTTANEPTAVDYAAKEAEDLIALRTQFPELAGMASLRELRDPARYGELRDLGLSAKEAYLATGGHRPYTVTDNRAHLHSAVPRTVHGTGDGISPAELSAARELFDGLSDHEIRRLYKRVSG